MGSTFTYLIIFSVTGLLTELSSRLSINNRLDKILNFLFTLIVLSIPAFFAGIRYGIGTDYFNYVSIFKNASFNSISRIEPGYNLINIVVREAGGNEHIFFFIISILTWFFIYQFLFHYRKNISVGLGMFIALLLFYNYSFNIVRQMLAISISLYSFKYIDLKKKIPFVLTALLATSIHGSSIIILPFYYLFNSLGNKRRVYKILIYVGIFIAIINYSAIVEFVSQNILNDGYYLKYAQEVESELGFGLLIISIPFLLPGIVFYKKLSDRNSSFDLYLFLTIISFLLRLIGYFGAPNLNRIGYFFNVASIWLIPFYFTELKSSRKWYWVPILSIIGILIYWYYTFIIEAGAGTIPYNTIFN